MTIVVISHTKSTASGMSGLVDRMFAVREFDSWRRHMSKRFIRSSGPGYLHSVCSELKKVVSDWQSVIVVSLNVHGRWRPPYQTGENCTYARTTQHIRHIISVVLSVLRTTEIMCLIWFLTLELWLRKTSTTWKKKHLERSVISYLNFFPLQFIFTINKNYTATGCSLNLYTGQNLFLVCVCVKQVLINFILKPERFVASLKNNTEQGYNLFMRRQSLLFQ